MLNSISSSLSTIDPIASVLEQKPVIPNLPPEIASNILEEALSSINSVEELNTLKTVSKRFNAAVEYVLTYQCPHIARRIMAETLTKMAGYWDVEKKELFFKNISAVIAEKPDLGLNIYNIFDQVTWPDYWMACQTVLDVISQRKNITIKTLELDAHTILTDDRKKTIFALINDIAKNPPNPSFRILLNLIDNEIGLDDIKSMVAAFNEGGATIEKLLLSDIHGVYPPPNATGNAVIQALVKLQHIDKLQSLSLKNSAISDAGVNILCQTNKNTALRSIDLSENPISCGGIQKLIQWAEYKYLDNLSLRKLNAPCMLALFNGLKENKLIHIKQLDVSFNSIDAQGVQALCELIRHQISIEEISLHGCKTNSMIPAKMLAEALKQNTILKCLRFFGLFNVDEVFEILQADNNNTWIKHCISFCPPFDKSLYISRMNSFKPPGYFEGIHHFYNA